jgi:hypothetical protein
VVDIHNTTDVPGHHRGSANRVEVGTICKETSGKSSGHNINF